MTQEDLEALEALEALVKLVQSLTPRQVMRLRKLVRLAIRERLN